jgi:hypothetical protein
VVLHPFQNNGLQIVCFLIVLKQSLSFYVLIPAQAGVINSSMRGVICMLKLVKERGNVSVSSSEVSPMASPVEALWTIELLYGKHPDYTELTYAVNFTTRLAGNASKCFLVIDLRERFDEYLRDLNIFGSLEKSELHKVIDYVKYLKINGIFKSVPSLLTVMEGSASNDESQELFEMVSDAIVSDPDSFPSISSDAYNLNPRDNYHVFCYKPLYNAEIHSFPLAFSPHSTL